MTDLSEKEAAQMSRHEALRTLATADGVPERDRRMAEIMLAGPSGVPAPGFRPRRDTMFVAVHLALAEHGAVLAEQRAADLEALAEIGGMRG